MLASSASDRPEIRKSARVLDGVPKLGSVQTVHARKIAKNVWA